MKNIQVDDVQESSERKRTTELLALGKQHNLVDEALRAVEKGTSAEVFRAYVDGKTESQPIPLPLGDGFLGLSGRDVKKYSFVRAIHAMASKDFSGAGFEVECSRATTRKLGREPQGFYVPADILAPKRRSLDTGTGTAGGYLVGTEHLGSEFIELLRAKAWTIQLGARLLTGLRGNVSIPSQTGPAAEYWLAEDVAITPSDQTFGSVSLSPKTCGALTRFTRRMLLQSDPSVEMLVQADLAAVLAGAVDRAVINGSGSSGQPAGILQTTGVASVTTSGALSWAKILEFPAAVEAANADQGNLAWLVNAPTKSRLLSTTKETGFPNYLWEYTDSGDGRIAGFRAVSSNNIPANLGVGLDKSAVIFGNWADIIIAQWGVLDLLSDPYTDADKGAVRTRAFLDVDIGLRHPASFAVAVDV